MIILERFDEESRFLTPLRFDSVEDAKRWMIDDIENVLGYGVNSKYFLDQVECGDICFEDIGCDIYNGPNGLNYFWKISKI